MGERKSEIKDLFSKRSHWLTLTFINRGNRPVVSLRIEVVVTDKHGAPLARETSYVVSSAGPALVPGQTWVVRTMTDLGARAPEPGEGFASYTVRVVEFE